MSVSLDSVELDPQARESAKEVVRLLAYHKWEAAGRPYDDGLPCWLAAEREWLERYYVPARPYEECSGSDRDTNFR